MAKPECNAADLKSSADERADFYIGTREELVRAGICEPDWFPEKLALEYRRDGRPKIGNSGTQRVKRKYVVEGVSPSVELTHRRDANGREYWVAMIRVSEEEEARRKADTEKKYDTQAREQEARIRERERQRAEEETAARPTVARLRKRYPDLVISGRLVTRDNGTALQIIDFYARSLDDLHRCGLISEAEVCAARNDGHCTDMLRDYSSGSIWWCQSEAGGEYYRLTTYTEKAPKERKHFPLTEARAALRRIAEAH